MLKYYAFHEVMKGSIVAFAFLATYSAHAQTECQDMPQMKDRVVCLEQKITKLSGVIDAIPSKSIPAKKLVKIPAVALAWTEGFYAGGAAKRDFWCVPQINVSAGQTLFGAEYGEGTRVGGRAGGCAEVPFCDSAGEFCDNHGRSEGCLVSTNWVDWYNNNLITVHGPLTPEIACR